MSQSEPADQAGHPSGHEADQVGQSANPAAAVDERPARALMIATYVAGGIGVFLGFLGISDEPPTLTAATLWAVGVAGVLSFVRHSLFARADAARLGWTSGGRNNFQIEVGLANLAWGIVGILTVALDAGIAAQGAALTVFGVYLTAVAVMVVVSPGGPRRAPAPLLAGLLFGVFLVSLGIRGMTV